MSKFGVCDVKRRIALSRLRVPPVQRAPSPLSKPPISPLAFVNCGFSLNKGGGKPTVITRTFTHPITQEDLDTIWDEQTLQLLLERSTDYEERRLIRVRLRDVMAEQEVCADVVTKTREESSGGVEGESLLLPLLQGLLVAPDNEQTPDSGTESGEDLRSGLLVEVQNVLGKLANSLKSESNDMTPERRNSLLQLVTRLQSGLSTQNSSSGEKRSNGQGRFSRRRRHNRHTVGVSSEELEHARRLIEEIGLSDPVIKPQMAAPLQKQKSEGNFLQYRIMNSNQPKAPIKNSIAKPYGSSASSSTVDTPTEVSEALDFSKPSDVPFYHEPHKTVASNFLPEIEIKVPVTQPNLNLLNNPVYSKPKSLETEDDIKINKYNNKKIKMKRANTIDIPKPATYYESEEDYESDASLVDKQNSRRNSYLALRGPIRVGRNSLNNTNVPILEPKTDSDRKFMAFINKHNENNNKSSMWTNQSQPNNRSENHWTNRFGHIRTAFEKASTSTPSTPNTNMSSAKNFWKQADSAVSSEKYLPNKPQGPRNIQNAFQEKKKEQKLPWTSADEKNIVTGTLKTDAKGIDANKTYKFVPQPLPVNKFSHAPTSAFAAIPKKDPPEITASIPKTNHAHIQTPSFIKSTYKENTSNNNAPLYLYSPKPAQPISPATTMTPWTNDEHRVQKLATSKFENNFAHARRESPAIKPQKLNKDKYITSVDEHEQATNKKLTAPYLVKSTDTSNNVKKISDQFNNKTPKPADTYSSYTTVKYDRTTPTTPNAYNYQPQNYTIIYGNPKPQPANDYYSQPYYQAQKTPEPIYQYQYRNYNPSPHQNYYEQPKPAPPQQLIQFTQPELNPSSSDSSPTPPKTLQQYNRQISQESVKEYEAAVSKVMKGPVTHQAVTVQQKSPKGRDEHDLDVAFNLKNALQKFSQPEKTERKFSMDSVIAQSKPAAPANVQRSQSFKKPKNPSFLVNGKSLSMESTEINEDGESVITSKFHIPVMINAKTQPVKEEVPQSKPSSWHEPQKVSPTTVARSKSSHSLAVPTVQFQAGMTKDEVVHKKRTMEAYFSGKLSPQSLSKSPSEDSLDKSDKTDGKANKTSINRKKTSEKVSIHKHGGGGVTRSRTLPNIVYPNLLDENKVEESFEDLFRSNA